MRLDLPKGRSLIGAINFGALLYGTSAIFFHWSLIEGSPRMFRIILALSPLITFLLAIVHQQENFHWRTLVGGLISLAGVGIVFHIGINAHVSVLSLTAVVLGAGSVTEAIVLHKSISKSHPITTNAIGMGVCALIIFVVSQLTGEVFIIPTQSSTWMAHVYLIIFGSIFSFVLGYVVKY
jgi:drug/metabolite transporter (DMT)-like permease